MIFIVDTQTDPYRNLAAEEHLLRNFAEPVFRLWRNAPCVVIGKNQNALTEIDLDYVEARGIKVVRRLSGGGAVFHDLGNVNFTFIDSRNRNEDTSAMFRRFTAPIIDALRNIGVNAALEGRNDLCIGGRKFSGNAICVDRDRVLMHGTLLFSASMPALAGALKNRPEKYSDKAVKSNVSRVTNISSHLQKPMTVEEFIDYLGDYIGRQMARHSYTEADLAAIDALARSKYSTREWNFAASPRYTFSNSAKLSCGLVEVSFDVAAGAITRLHIGGDFFFTKPIEEFCECLIGCPHSKTKIAEAVSATNLGDYFGNVSASELTELFF
ncbi:MAG: lipoate--protein ligase [Bacteroidales bacterium]|nr:lipoate--protein ligase [Bacteroidales bacterium]